MNQGTLRLSADLSALELSLLAALVLLSWILLALEVRRRGGRGLPVLLSGVLGVGLLSLAVARPVRVREGGVERGARVVALVDRSERLLLPGDTEESRRALGKRAVEALRERFRGQRLEVWSFGDGALVPERDGAPPKGAAPNGTTPNGASPSSAAPLSAASDLIGALGEAAQLPGERPAAVVVLSDGRLSTPGPLEGVPSSGGGSSSEAATVLGRHPTGVPLHTVSLASRIPRDRSIRAVRTTGSAVAHQAFPLTVEAGCEPTAWCHDAEIVVRELLEQSAPRELARGRVEFARGVGVVELSVTVERAGSRVLEVAMETADGDEVPQNDRKLVPIEVRRDRTRILHVAGRPTYDVRALRLFLKADESIDLVTFFILRTPNSRSDAVEGELSLIPFPVDELFTEHLASFDAIILQDIDARAYGLAPYFPALSDYVTKGGGLILVGGPGAYAGGGYAHSPLAEVLPVEVPASPDAVVKKSFEPRYTAAGLAAPMLAGLRDALGTRLPWLEGANRVGPARPGAFVLWEHPGVEVTGAGRSGPMPLLSLGESGDGRSIALGIDGSHLLRFGELGARASGRGHTALWEGLLGWLMRDPRYEAAQLRGPSPCFAGHPFELTVTPLPDMADEVTISLERLGDAEPLSAEQAAPRRAQGARSGRPVVVSMPGLPTGAYAARARVGEAPAARWVFVCEEGGGSWADSRPDPDRLRKLAELSHGQAVDAAHVDDLPLPAAERVLAFSTSRPLLPDWAWATLATVAIAAHFWLRRAGGYA
ncbi:MAG TPA: glutamine amidotransferase [Polyangiaceae bacterium]|nr:glutamine amidotransferase [Polyangiaceae bacterium]